MGGVRQIKKGVKYHPFEKYCQFFDPAGEGRCSNPEFTTIQLPYGGRMRDFPFCEPHYKALVHPLINTLVNEPTLITEPKVTEIMALLIGRIIHR